MPSVISYINLSWAVVGIIDKDVHNSLQSMKRPEEPIEVTIERYVVGYLAFWHIAYIDKEKMATLPKFYIVFLNQPHIGCDTHGLSDVFCV